MGDATCRPLVLSTTLRNRWHLFKRLASRDQPHISFPFGPLPLSCPTYLQAQVVAALRGYGRLPTARPPGGISSGRLLSSPSVRSASAKVDEDEDYEEGAAVPSQRPRRTRKMSSASPGGSRGLAPASEAATPAVVPAAAAAAVPPSAEVMDWQALLQLPHQDGQGQAVVKQEAGAQATSNGHQAAAGAVDGATAAVGNGLQTGAGPKQQPPSPVPQAQVQLHALSTALLAGDARVPSALSDAAAAGAGAAATAGGSGMDGRPPVPRPPAKGSGGSRGGLPVAGGTSPVGAFESVLWRIMSQSHELARPEDAVGEGMAPRPLHSGPKGQSGFKGVTLYK